MVESERSAGVVDVFGQQSENALGWGVGEKRSDDHRGPSLRRGSTANGPLRGRFRSSLKDEDLASEKPRRGTATTARAGGMKEEAGPARAAPAAGAGPVFIPSTTGRWLGGH